MTKPFSLGNNSRVGIISDTHGLLRPEAVKALESAELIMHAGDIGNPAVLRELNFLAPVAAVRGNMDGDSWARGLPASEVVEFPGGLIYLLHDVSNLDLDPLNSGVKVVVCGHSHRPYVKKKKGVLYLNPGSAGPRRFTLPVSVAMLHIENASVAAQIITLDV